MTALDTRQIAEKELKRAAFPAVRQEMRVVFAEAAFDRAVARGDGDTSREIGGVLVGELLRDDSGPFLRVDATIDALHAEEKGAELTFTHATWEHIHKQMDEAHEGKKIVGWYHTHPGFGIFLSDRDEFIHKSFFNLPFQIALVYDPKSKEHGVFAWREGAPVRSRRYWVGDREHLWDGARVATPREERPPKSLRGGASKRADDAKADEARPAKGEEEPGSWSMRSIAAGSLIAAILGAAGGFWLGTRDARAALQQMDAELSRVRSDAMRGAIREIDAQLVGMLRSTIGNDAVQRPLEQMIADLEEADRIFTDAPAPGTPELEVGLAKIRLARDRGRRIRDDRGDAHAALARLEEAARQGALSPAEMTRDLGVVRAGLGALYAELAGDALRAGDVRRAERLLAVAASVDPANRARYEQAPSLEPPRPGAPLPPAPPNVAPRSGKGSP